MASIKSIFIENAQTFYDFRSGTRQAVRYRYGAIFLVAAIFTWIFRGASDNVYMSIIAAQSILVGFSFNVMIFLGTNPNIKAASNASIERKNKVAKLNTLSKELFYNLSYFNIIAIFSVVISLVLLLAPAAGPSMDYLKGVVAGADVRDPSTETLIDAMLRGVGGILWLLLYYSMIDSLASFLRITRRASYYFESKMALSD